MYFSSFKEASRAHVTILILGYSSNTFRTPSGADTTFKKMMWFSGTEASFSSYGLEHFSYSHTDHLTNAASRCQHWIANKHVLLANVLRKFAVVELQWNNLRIVYTRMFILAVLIALNQHLANRCFRIKIGECLEERIACAWCPHERNTRPHNGYGAHICGVLDALEDTARCLHVDFFTGHFANTLLH